MSVYGLLFAIRFHGVNNENLTFCDEQVVGAMHQRASCCGMLQV